MKGWNFSLGLDGVVYFIKHVDRMIDVAFSLLEVDIEYPSVPVDVGPPLGTHLLQERLPSQSVVVDTKLFSFFDNFLLSWFFVPVNLLRKEFALVEIDLLANRITHAL